MNLRRLPKWSEQAACAGLATRDRDLWTPAEDTPEERGFELHLARMICAQCPVRVECVNDELAMLDQVAPESMRGGLTPDELVEAAKFRGMPYRRRAQCGTRSKYVAGCRCDLCRDAHRVYEHERRLWARSRPVPEVVFVALALPTGRGKRRVEAGQLLLFTTGLPDRFIEKRETA